MSKKLHYLYLKPTIQVIYWIPLCNFLYLQDSISMLSSYPSSTTLYQEEDTVSLGAYSLQTPMEHSNMNDYNSRLMKPPS